MLLVPSDRIVLENFAYGDTPTRHSVGRFVDLLVGQPDSFFLSYYKLSFETDIRLLVLRTLLTYLELDGYIKATSPRYESYKIKPLVTSNVILNHFDGERRKFVAGVLSCLTKGRTWFTLNMVVAAKRLETTRERIVKAIEYMVERNWLEVKVSDLVHGYRWLRKIDQPKLLADDLTERLNQREQSEIARLDDVFQLAFAESCQSEHLSSHFGESLPRPCGHCSACVGDGPFVIPPVGKRSIGTAAKTYIDRLAHEYPDHFVTARDRARFLCGLSTPRLVRAKLTRDPNFGICETVPFANVLAEVQ
jgi:ATP-dependent DNA helicase RecQ